MKKITIVLSIVLMTFTTGLLAQNLNSAGKAYNKGIELAGEGKTMEAIESYNKCAEICAELGEVGEGLKIKAETQVTNLYMNMGIEKLKAKKYDSAIILLTETKAYADKLDDPATSDKLNNYFAAAYTGKGIELYKTKKYMKAADEYNKALEFNPKYGSAHYYLVLTYSKLDDSGMLEESVNNVMKYSTKEDQKTKANLAAGSYYLKSAHNAVKDEQYNIATAMAEKSLMYNPDNAQTFYLLALAYNEQENWGNAVKAAEKSVSYEGEDKSSYYFELGRAYEGMENKEKACEAYGKVTKGPNKDAAEYQRVNVLRCY
jgi:tetratricopeptide (TPR) repeat protein